VTKPLQGKCSVPGCQFDAWRAVTGNSDLCPIHEIERVYDMQTGFYVCPACRKELEHEDCKRTSQSNH